MKKQELFLWLDLETTGFSPAKNQIIEVAAILTDRYCNEIDSFQAVIKPTGLTRLFPKQKLHPVVWKMHNDNGLWKECIKEGRPLKEVYEDFYYFIERHFEKGPIFIVGNSIGALDLPFLRKQMPAVMDLVHYRTIDITGLRMGIELLLNKKNLLFTQKSSGTHRAMDDVKNSILQFKNYKVKLIEYIQENAIQISVQTTSQPEVYEVNLVDE